MAAAGCDLLANPVSRSAMLLGAFLTHSRYWFKLLSRIRRELRAIKPSVVIPIDSSAINLRIANLARRENLPVCYYVAPQIWASRPWRIKKVRARINTLCCILPFEEAYFRERGVNAVYVGHPMFDLPADTAASDPRLASPAFPIPPGDAPWSAEASVAGLGPRIAVFPGSRRAEVRAHMPPMLEILSEIKGRFPQAVFVAVAPSEERAWQIRHDLRGANTPVEIRVGGSDNADAAIRWADLVLTKSGTATLQIARHHKPMVVLFSVKWWIWHLFARFFITTRYIALVNILAGREIVPEFIPFYGSPLPVARQCIALLADARKRVETSKELAELVKPLHPHGGILAADRVAAEVAKLTKG
jgi:lipid-A-disaccharide synthase